ncbi:MAG: hypothetical protein CK426_06705 [Legionella sp.]|nr:MAG: hypothetical protein CK423_06675 [Legionella sp.]PJD98387.1 MAG: hypothetical protein CK426_06705 [Legionella sp.]
MPQSVTSSLILLAICLDLSVIFDKADVEMLLIAMSLFFKTASDLKKGASYCNSAAEALAALANV